MQNTIFTLCVCCTCTDSGCIPCFRAMISMVNLASFTRPWFTAHQPAVKCKVSCCSSHCQHRFCSRSATQHVEKGQERDTQQKQVFIHFGERVMAMELLPRKSPEMNTEMIIDERPNSVPHPNYSNVNDIFTETPEK